MQPQEMVRNRVREFAQKLGKPEDEVMKMVHSIYEEEKRLHGLSDAAAIDRALRRLYVRHRAEMISPASWYKGVFIGAAGKMDAFAKLRRDCQNMAANDKVRAIDLKYISPDGKPLDYRMNLPNGMPNPRYGQPLPDNVFIRMTYFYGINVDLPGAKPLLYRMVFRQACADIEPPLYKVVKFRALERPGLPGDFPVLVSPSPSVFKIENADGTIDLAKLFENDLAYLRQKLSAIDDLHKSRGPTTVIVAGDVLTISETPQVKVLTLWDDDLPEQDKSGRPHRGITVFCRDPVAKYVDFGPESRVYVIGRTTATRLPDRTPGPAGITALGIWAPPEFKVAPKTPVEAEVIHHEIAEPEDTGLWE